MDKILVSMNNFGLANSLKVQLEGRISGVEVELDEGDGHFDHRYSLRVFDIADYDDDVGKLKKHDSAVIIIGVDEKIETYQSQNAKIVFLKLDEEDFDYEPFVGAAKRLLRITEQAKKRKKYCPIQLDYIIYSNKLACDTYIQINEEKYLKIYNKGDPFSLEDLIAKNKKYLNKLCVERPELKRICKSLTKNVDDHIQNGRLKPKSLMRLSTKMLELTQNMLSEFGFRPDTLELANVYLDATLQNIKKKPDLMDVLKSFLKKNNYLSNHSALLNYVSCFVASKLPDTTEATHIKLSVASFFHDIKLDDDEQAMITKSEEMDRYINAGKVKILNHGYKAAHMLDDLKGPLVGVHEIIKQHHESPDGTGFPEGIDHRTISPLSGLFMLCHEFVDGIFKGKSPQDLLEFLNVKYDYQKFHPALKALEEILKTR